MKKITLLVIIAFLSTNAFAELFDKGLKVGLNFTNFQDAAGGNTETGTAIGAFVRINLPVLLFQPEVYYSNTKTEYTIHDRKTEVDLSAIDVPLLVGWRMINMKKLNVRLMAGPVFSFYLKGDDKVKEHNIDDNIDVGESINSPSISMQAGLGADFLKFTFDVRYGFNFADPVKVFTEDYIHIAVGYKF